MNSLQQFSKKNYLNLETFRKSGVGVRTPVWFVQDAETFYVLTMAGSGKVKRIHNNGRVNIAPCKVNGTPTGTWVQAVAAVNTEAQVFNQVIRLLDKKYGLLRKLFFRDTSNQDRHDIVLEIKLVE